MDNAKGKRSHGEAQCSDGDSGSFRKGRPAPVSAGLRSHASTPARKRMDGLMEEETGRRAGGVVSGRTDSETEPMGRPGRADGADRPGRETDGK